MNKVIERLQFIDKEITRYSKMKARATVQYYWDYLNDEIVSLERERDLIEWVVNVLKESGEI